jgi:hypothetical protein
MVILLVEADLAVMQELQLERVPVVMVELTAAAAAEQLVEAPVTMVVMAVVVLFALFGLELLVYFLQPLSQRIPFQLQLVHL